MEDKLIRLQIARTGSFGADGRTVTTQDLQDVIDTFDGRCPISLGHYAARKDDWWPSWGNVENLTLEKTEDGNAVLIGDTVIGDECSIWFGAVLRGDVNSIRIGNRVNIQDGSVLHTLYEKSTIEIGDDVSIGHNVTIHGATIHDGALVGMGSVILDHAVVGEGAIVAAGSVVLSKTVIKPGELWGGTPAKFIKMVDPEQSKEINQKIAKNYLMYSTWYEEE